MPKRSEKWHRNKMAFNEVIGDPYGFPEPIVGHYVEVQHKSSVSILDTSKQSSPSPMNKARPSAVDFCVDVDKAIEDGMDTYGEDLEKFINTYIREEGYIFRQKERSKIEQIIGNILIQRRISPVAKYFTTIKQ